MFSFGEIQTFKRHRAGAERYRTFDHVEFPSREYNFSICLQPWCIPQPPPPPSFRGGGVHQGREATSPFLICWLGSKGKWGGGERPEKVHEITFLSGTLPYDLSIPCRFKVELILKGLNFTNGTSIFNHEFVYLKILKFSDIYWRAN